MEAIFELDRKLADAGIPHTLREIEGNFGWQITYPEEDKWELRKPGCGDVVWNEMSYGHWEGLLEAMGFDITTEKDGDEVVGWLTVDKAFDYFKRQWEKDNANA